MIICKLCIVVKILLLSAHRHIVLHGKSLPPFLIESPMKESKLHIHVVGRTSFVVNYCSACSGGAAG